MEEDGGEGEIFKQEQRREMGTYVRNRPTTTLNFALTPVSLSLYYIQQVSLYVSVYV